MRIGFKTSQMNVEWPTLKATWELGDSLPVFDSAWIFDHFVALGEGGGGSHEAFTMLAALQSGRTLDTGFDSPSPLHTTFRDSPGCGGFWKERRILVGCLLNSSQASVLLPRGLFSHLHWEL